MCDSIQHIKGVCVSEEKSKYVCVIVGIVVVYVQHHEKRVEILVSWLGGLVCWFKGNY